MTKIELSRRLLLQNAATVPGTVTVLELIAEGAAAEVQVKASQQVAGYQNTASGGNRCGNCAQFQPPATCRVVAGRISPQGWCRLFFPKTS
jgi:hypothetical protein